MVDGPPNHNNIYGRQHMYFKFGTFSTMLVICVTNELLLTICRRRYMVPIHLKEATTASIPSLYPSRLPFLHLILVHLSSPLLPFLQSPPSHSSNSLLSASDTSLT
uniref:Uncharacterized protein n=1 Tax=Cucumis melo TaxID=3656 RepID=A0A9I9EGR5_CUCME